MPSRLSWIWGGAPDEAWRIAKVRLEEQMEDLEDYLRELHQENSFGPVPGAYIPIRFTGLNSPVATGTQDLTMMPFAMRPIALSVWTENSASIYTIQLRYDTGAGPVDILSSDKQITHKELFNTRGDFAVDSIPSGADLYFVVVSVGDSTSPVPNYLRAMLVGKNASKVEPA